MKSTPNTSWSDYYPAVTRYVHMDTASGLVQSSLAAVSCSLGAWCPQDAGPLPSRVLGADDLFPILCFIVARGADIETTRPIHTRLTTLLAWCSAMADGGGGEGEWMVQSMRAALTLLIENASVATQLGAAS